MAPEDNRSDNIALCYQKPLQLPCGLGTPWPGQGTPKRLLGSRMLDVR